MTTSSTMECGDFLEFQVFGGNILSCLDERKKQYCLEYWDTLQKMRQIDDKIIYLLNTTIPTESFKGQVDATAKCKDLFHQIQSGHSQREIAIKKCLSTTRDRVKKLREEKDSKPDDLRLVKTLRMEQNNLRMLESELTVEEVVKSRTTKVYHEKCRGYYKPSES